MPDEPIACTPKLLKEECHDDAALAAINENPLNAPHVRGLVELMPDVDRSSIAMVTSKYWRTGGVRLTVGFLDNPETALRKRILEHMNAWARTGNIAFVETQTDPQVRITRGDTGYWSYIGTDILLIDADKPTMNLQGFTMNTPDSEFYRVVRHETGHTLGCPHEHMRAEEVARIDVAKAIAYYGATQGWSPAQVRAQVLTPLEQASIIGNATDECSIMCYHIPGRLTKTGEPIAGGKDIDESDYAFIGKVYPKPAAPAAPAAALGELIPVAAPLAANRRMMRIDLRGGERIVIPHGLSIPEIGQLVRGLRD